MQTKPAAREPRPTAVFNVSSFSRDENETTTVHWAKEHETLKRWVAGGLCEQSVDAVYQEGLPQIFMYVCSGPRRRGDYIDQCMKLARQNYHQCLGLRIDPSIDLRLDILNGSLVILIRQLIDEGRLGGLLCTPPCGTWSRVRHMPLNRGCAGPRPLRTRDAPLTYISDRSMKEHKACETGTRIATACVYLVGLALEHFIWTALVHPQDPDPFPSVFHSPMADLLRKFGARDICLDQCQFGLPARKSTQMLVGPSLDFFRHLQQRCNHVTSHQPTLGAYHDGTFRTSQFNHFPVDFCKALSLSTWHASQQRSKCSHGCRSWEFAFQGSIFFAQHPAGSQSPAVSGRAFRFQK